MRKTIILIAVALLLTINIVAAAESAEPTQQNLQELETKRLIIEENAKVKAELRQYIERKVLDIESDMQASVDENFRELDSRMDTKIRKAGFKIGIILLTSIVLGGSINLWIQRTVKKKRMIRQDMNDQNIKEKLQIPVQQIGKTDDTITRVTEKEPEKRAKPTENKPDYDEIPAMGK